MALRFWCLLALIAGQLDLSFGQPGFDGIHIPDIGEFTDHCNLRIRPAPVHDIYEGENGIFYCDIVCDVDTNQTLRHVNWFDNTGNTVPHIPASSEDNGANYWMERYLRLRIKAVRRDQEGSYKCKGYVKGQWISRTTYLRVIVRQPTTTTVTSITATTTGGLDSGFRPSSNNNQEPSFIPRSQPASSTSVRTTSQFTSVDTQSFPTSTSEASTTSSYVTSLPTTGVPERSTQAGIDGARSTQTDIDRASRDVQSTSATSSFPEARGEHEDATSVETSSPSSEAPPTSLSTSPPSSTTIDASSAPDNRHREPVTRREHTNNDSAGDAPDILESTGGVNVNREIDNTESVPISSSTVMFIPEPVVHRKKRSPDKSNSKKNGSMNINVDNSLSDNNVTLIEDCSGFGPSAIATIAILGSFCLILFYAFILVLCFPKFRKRNSANLEKPPKDIEEGEGIEIKEGKPEMGQSDPNGRIMRDDSGFTTIDINDAESPEPAPAPATEDTCRSNDVEAVATQEKSVNNEEEMKDSPKSAKEGRMPEQSTVVVESPPPPLPVPLFAPVEVQQRVEVEQCEVVPMDVQNAEELPSSGPEEDVESSLSEAIDPEPEESSPIRDDLPVFDEPMQDDIEPISVSSNEPSVELQDKSVDTVELEAEDLDEPADDLPMEMINHVDYEDLPDRELRAPIFDTETPEINGLYTDDELSNSIQEVNPYPVTKTMSDRDEMTKSIEDLPPPPPLPVGPPPPPPISSDPSASGMETPDVVSSNTTLV